MIYSLAFRQVLDFYKKEEENKGQLTTDFNSLYMLPALFILGENEVCTQVQPRIENILKHIITNAH